MSQVGPRSCGIQDGHCNNLFICFSRFLLITYTCLQQLHETLGVPEFDRTPREPTVEFPPELASIREEDEADQDENLDNFEPSSASEESQDTQMIFQSSQKNTAEEKAGNSSPQSDSKLDNKFW